MSMDGIINYHAAREFNPFWREKKLFVEKWNPQGICVVNINMYIVSEFNSVVR